jgi:hypothetical protein
LRVGGVTILCAYLQRNSKARGRKDEDELLGHTKVMREEKGRNLRREEVCFIDSCSAIPVLDSLARRLRVSTNVYLRGIEVPHLDTLLS